MADDNEKWGHYLIQERLAHGGMAEVYKAKTVDPNGIERLVVIKRILPHIASNSEYVNMLIDEAKIAVHFTHGNIAQVYDLGKIGDDYFIVMEYVDGKTIGQIQREMRARDETIPLDILAYTMMELCRGLDYIHRKSNNEGEPLGVVHRDVSPQNIILSYSANVKIIDFGVAKADDKASHTESGVLKGKFAYMSPEQADGLAVDRRSDIFSAGVLLWELLTQKRLFKRKTNRDTIKAVIKAQYKLPSKLRPDVPKALDRIVDRALQRKAAKRYQYASEMAVDLEQFLRTYNPDFRPVRVAQFLYRYFGPEPDEANLPLVMPEIEVAQLPPPDPDRLKEIDGESVSKVPNQASAGMVRITESRPESVHPTQLAPEEEVTEVEPIAKKGRQRLVLSMALGLFLVAIGYVVFQALNPAPKGHLYLEITPPNASLTINHQRIEPSADGVYYLEYLAHKPMTVLVEAEGFLEVTQHVTLAPNQERELTVELEPKVAPFANLSIKTNPSGGSIFIDDTEWTTQSPTVIPRLNSGQQYEIVVRLEGYHEYRENVFLEPGATQELNITLNKAYGELEFFSNPPGAYVIVDGQIVGKTPYRDRRVEPAEAIEYEFKMEGFRTLIQKIVIGPGEKKRITVDLERQ